VNVRDRSLLDLAHRIHECTNCRRYMPHGCSPAHQNGIEAGKGQSIKGQDNRHAALCDGPGGCHPWYDTGSGADPSLRYASSKVEKFEMWVRAHLATFDLYFANGWIIVARYREAACS
jgi:hypothetical protein